MGPPVFGVSALGPCGGVLGPVETGPQVGSVGAGGGKQVFPEAVWGGAGSRGIRRGGWGPLGWSRALQLALCVPAWGPGPTDLRPQGQRLDTGLLVQAVEPEPPKCGPGIQLPACPGAFCIQGRVDGTRYGAGAPDLSLTGSPVVWLPPSPTSSTEAGRDPCTPLHALCGALHPRCVFLAPFQSCSGGRVDAPLLDQVHLASRRRKQQSSPQTLPANQGLTPGWEDCSHPPHPKNLWGQVLPPSLRPWSLLGPPREHHCWAVEAPSFILEPQASRTQFCGVGSGLCYSTCC